MGVKFGYAWDLKSFSLRPLLAFNLLVFGSTVGVIIWSPYNFFQKIVTTSKNTFCGFFNLPIFIIV